MTTLYYLLAIYDHISCIPVYAHMNLRAAMFEYLKVGYKRRSCIYLLSFVKVPKIFKLPLGRTHTRRT